jgi:hypothetical protein
MITSFPAKSRRGASQGRRPFGIWAARLLACLAGGGAALGAAGAAAGSETDPTTNDMPDGIWIGFGAAGLAFVGWGAWLRLRRKRPQEEPRWRPRAGHPRARRSRPLWHQRLPISLAWVARRGSPGAAHGGLPTHRALSPSPNAIPAGQRLSSRPWSPFSPASWLRRIPRVCCPAATSRPLSPTWSSPRQYRSGAVPGLGGSGCGSAKTASWCVITFAPTGSAGRRCAVSRTDR